MKARRPELVLLLAWIALPILIPFVLALAGKPLYSHRYGAIGLPAFLVLVASGYVWLSPGWRVALGLVAVSITGVSLTKYYTQHLKDDWRSATTTIQQNYQPNDLLVFDTGIEVSSFRHYAGAARPVEAVALDLRANDLSLWGFLVRDGERTHTGTADYTEAIFSRERVCLILCVPGRSEADHTVTFRDRGFELTGSADFHRIRVLWFSRRS